MKYLRKIKLKQRLIISFLLFSIVPMLFISVFTFHISSNSTKKKIDTSSKQLLSLININMVTEIEKYQYLCGSICINSDIQSALESELKSAEERNATTKKIQEIVLSKIIYPAHAKNITILDKDGNTFYDLGYDGFYSSDLRKMYEKLNESDSDLWTYVKTYRQRDIIVLGRKIYNQYGAKKVIGYALISIDEALFSKTVLNPAEIGDGSNIFLMDSNGVVLSSWDRCIPLGEKYHSAEIIKNINIINKVTGSFSIDVDGDRQLVTYFYNRDIDKFFLSFIPYSYINSEANQIAYDIGLGTIVTMIISFIIVIFIYRSISLPITVMTECCKAISTGDLDIRINDNGHDELTYLSNSIDIMVTEIGLLMEEEKEQEAQKREVELRMLQYQINPHFLFNTLNTLKLVASMNHDYVVSDGIKSLSELLKNTLVDKNEFISIGAELTNLQNYMAIMNIRYAGSFKYELDVDEGLLGCQIPKLLLQPLVENAIVHGSRNDGSILNIFIRCHESDGNVLLTIEDDGIGFDLNSPQSSDPLKGLGTANVNERIKLNFGEPYGLNITSLPGEGTTCNVLIPIVRL